MVLTVGIVVRTPESARSNDASMVARSAASPELQKSRLLSRQSCCDLVIRAEIHPKGVKAPPSAGIANVNKLVVFTVRDRHYRVIRAAVIAMCTSLHGRSRPILLRAL
jgi:hypothetical protein